MVERLNPFKVCLTCNDIASWVGHKQDYICKRCDVSRLEFEKKPVCWQRYPVEGSSIIKNVRR